VTFNIGLDGDFCPECSYPCHPHCFVSRFFAVDQDSIPFLYECVIVSPPPDHHLHRGIPRQRALSPLASVLDLELPCVVVASPSPQQADFSMNPRRLSLFLNQPGFRAWAAWANLCISHILETPPLVAPESTFLMASFSNLAPRSPVSSVTSFQNPSSFFLRHVPQQSVLFPKLECLPLADIVLVSF